MLLESLIALIGEPKTSSSLSIIGFEMLTSESLEHSDAHGLRACAAGPRRRGCTRLRDIFVSLACRPRLLCAPPAVSMSAIVA